MLQHGDDIYNYPNIQINFSSNIWGHANLSALKDYLALHLDVIDNYPEPDAHSLESLIAEKVGISRDEVLVTNGATEGIYLLHELFQDAYHDIPQPTFAEYHDSGLRFCHRNIHNCENRRTVHWLCNPNNPTGKWSDLSQVIDSQDIFIIDQAYENYTLHPSLHDTDTVKEKNIILLHSMTKKYCIPGIRLGYVTAHHDIIARLRMLKQPWSVNALALQAGMFLLENDIHVLPDMHHLLDETQKFRKQIDHIEGFMTYPTDTNFFLIEHKGHAHTGSIPTLKTYLATRGILVRDCSNFKNLSSHFIRVATQLPEENKELIKWFKQYPYS